MVTCKLCFVQIISDPISCSICDNIFHYNCVFEKYEVSESNVIICCSNVRINSPVVKSQLQLKTINHNQQQTSTHDIENSIEPEITDIEMNIDETTSTTQKNKLINNQNLQKTNFTNIDATDDDHQQLSKEQEYNKSQEDSINTFPDYSSI